MNSLNLSCWEFVPTFMELQLEIKKLHILIQNIFINANQSE